MLVGETTGSRQRRRLDGACLLRREYGGLAFQVRELLPNNEVQVPALAEGVVRGSPVGMLGAATALAREQVVNDCLHLSAGLVGGRRAFDLKRSHEHGPTQTERLVLCKPAAHSRASTPVATVVDCTGDVATPTVPETAAPAPQPAPPAPPVQPVQPPQPPQPVQPMQSPARSEARSFSNL